MGKPPYPPARAQTLLLLRATLRWCRWLTVGRGDAVGYQWVAGRRLIFLFSAAQPSAPCQRKNRQLVSRMGLGDTSFICSPAADLVQTRTRPWTSQCPCVCWRGQVQEQGMLNLPVMESRGAAQSTLLSLTNHNSGPGFILFSSWQHILDKRVVSGKVFLRHSNLMDIFKAFWFLIHSITSKFGAGSVWFGWCFHNSCHLFVLSAELSRDSLSFSDVPITKITLKKVKS